MFASRITTPPSAIPQIEDTFTSTASCRSTDDVQNSHGTPGSHVIYHSRRFGDLQLRIPRHPDAEEGRKLFAHHLWNAGVICADALEEASQDDETPPSHGSNSGLEHPASAWDKRYWDVRGRTVLEVGAGTALPSIVAALSGAASTTITDHPSSPALTTSAIEQNVKINILERDKRRGTDNHTFSSSSTSSSSLPSPDVNISGYTWGTTTFYSPSSYGKRSPRQPRAFDRIIVADCLWMPFQHVNLVKTIVQYLDESRPGSCALVVAGFHTGREIVRHFFEVATGQSAPPSSLEDGSGFKETKSGVTKDTDLDEVRCPLRLAEIFEIDVNGLRRPWEPVRSGEAPDAAKRWCVVAVLVRK
ncbi:hypothetical protein G647_05212 [Cladophialophora carrionii CBS 160.54]|uniref:Nicotinamide N-methyltransferase n=1 Tax=Cladophialophora carrionii CBS 160.54 TaxID=1279043 RepID=V9D9A6_9EURO|nr:uncharacterized protein G647_05212 [Cladophialophora carrionii CBS 160.54]ETI23410.1 hypothetical protein G647_05212 [Cladophialophora carrionii CBS 160.54]